MQVFGEKIEGKNYKNREGAYGIAINKLNQVAIIQTSHGDFLPGGGIEKGETKEECLKREFIEETGYNIEIKQLVCRGIEYRFSPKMNKYLKLIGSFYLINLEKDTGLRSEDDHELVWKTKEELEESMGLEYQFWAIQETFKLLNIEKSYYR
ncbi:NUDIX domain-containing protein [Caloranaerobacter ferrireducens]|uniref:NUDIX domain-containing protein n=1 Tax=Caloranaerobacter ferrireducens TaxID=1323370 RepID=UPI00084D26AE|nr:NUDIX domain-containing protein [Caloranaerobacter ferrireducens]